MRRAGSPPKGGLRGPARLQDFTAVPHRSHIFMVFAAGFLLVAAFVAPAAPAGTSAEQSLLAAVNTARVSNGLPPLHLDATLARAARAHSADMLRHDFFAHGAFGSRMLAFHVQGPTEGENIAWGTGPYARPEMIVKEWLASPEHRANLLRLGYSRVGLGIVRGTFHGSSGATVVTADFAGR